MWREHNGRCPVRPVPGRVGQYRDGIERTRSDGTRVIRGADDPDGHVAVVSHAHGNHFPEGEATAVYSPLTAALATARREEPLHRTADDRADLLPASHVAGSTAVLVTDPDGTCYLYAGGVCTCSRFHPESGGHCSSRYPESHFHRVHGSGQAGNEERC